MEGLRLTPRPRVDWLPIAALLWLAACGSKAETADAGWLPGDAASVDMSAFASTDASIKPGDAAAAELGTADLGTVDADAEANVGDAGAPDSAAGSDVLGPLDTDDAGVPIDAAEPDSGPEPVCGDGICSGAETWSTCWVDCEAPKSVCGDAVCTPGENPISCQIDCDPDTLGVIKCLKSKCGSQTSACLAVQACTDFLANGAQCLANCVDANCVIFCQDMTNPNSAALAVAKCGFAACADAGAATICGNGSCDAGETAASCPADCGTPSAGTCADGTCSATESADSCPMDCDADFKKAWACGKAKCPAESAKCQAEPACLDALAQASKCLKKCGSGQSCLGQCRGPVLANSTALAYATCGLQNCQ